MAEQNYGAWVELFSEFWSDPKKNLPRFRDLMDPEARLRAPGMRSTKGWDEGMAAFEGMLAALPDLTGQVHRWSAAGDTLFVEMTFSATVGGRKTQWHNVDRFFFRGSRAIERVAYFDPLKLYRAFLTSPKGIRQLIRLRWGV